MHLFNFPPAFFLTFGTVIISATITHHSGQIKCHPWSEDGRVCIRRCPPLRLEADKGTWHFPGPAEGKGAALYTGYRGNIMESCMKVLYSATESEERKALLSLPLSLALELLRVITAARRPL